MKIFTSYLKKAFGITLVLIVLCGVVYPLVMTGAGQLLFKKQANGSMIEINRSMRMPQERHLKEKCRQIF